ncbi:MAG: hypothetical protein HY326_10355 [Chloroflexi bacterium]|nr:hypothetical protein [Chloroflexota bacterium]
MSGTKLFIVILVIVAVLFMVGIGAGVTQSSSGKVDSAIGRLQPLLEGALKSPLPLEDLQVVPGSPAACLQGRAILVAGGGTCSFTIHAAEGFLAPPVRTLMLHLTAGSAVDVRLGQQDAITAKERLTAGDAPKEVDVFKNGGALSITCPALGGNACRLELQ